MNEHSRLHSCLPQPPAKKKKMPWRPIRAVFSHSDPASHFCHRGLVDIPDWSIYVNLLIVGEELLTFDREHNQQIKWSFLFKCSSRGKKKVENSIKCCRGDDDVAGLTINVGLIEVDEGCFFLSLTDSTEAVACFPRALQLPRRRQTQQWNISRSPFGCTPELMQGGQLPSKMKPMSSNNLQRNNERGAKERHVSTHEYKVK